MYILDAEHHSSGENESTSKTVSIYKIFCKCSLALTEPENLCKNKIYTCIKSHCRSPMFFLAEVFWSFLPCPHCVFTCSFRSSWILYTGIPHGLPFPRFFTCAPCLASFSKKSNQNSIRIGGLTHLSSKEQDQFSSVIQLCLMPCNPMDCSMPDFPVHYQHSKLAQTHVHWVSDAIQPSHPLSSPSHPALSLSQNQGLFK